jgi:hypothetical protein
MKKPKVPAEWELLRPGDTIHSRMPFHKMEAIAAQLPDRRFIFVPSSTGYYIRREAAQIPPDLKVVK